MSNAKALPDPDLVKLISTGTGLTVRERDRIITLFDYDQARHQSRHKMDND